MGLTIGFKLVVIFTIVPQMLVFIGMVKSDTMACNVSYVVERYQYWRLLGSLLSGFPLTPYAVIFFIFCVWVLFVSMPSLVQNI